MNLPVDLSDLMETSIDTEVTLNGLVVNRVPTPHGGMELRICPSSKSKDRVAHREEISGRPESVKITPSATKPDSMVQVKLAQDAMDFGFLSGTTMQDSRTTSGLCVVPVEESDRVGLGDDVLVTALLNEVSKVRVCHFLKPTPVEGTLLSWTRVTNIGDEPFELEHLSSFVLSGLTPFAPEDAPGRLKMHRFRSWWSNEGQHESRSLEDLHLVRNWGGWMLPNERFGQVGTQPVRKFFPFVALEDTEAGVLWGAQLAWAGSWQMEVTRRADQVSLSGGLADYEFGHWKKAIQPGESFVSPIAHLASVAGEIDELTDRLVSLQEALLPEPPEAEKELPVMFNEWCTNWGSPSHDKTIALAKRLQGSGVKYLVIDDGWAKRPPEAKAQSNGDWIVDQEKFPHGMKATCDELKAMGFVPGVWFEFEVCNPGSKAFEETDHLLHRNGRVLDVGSRRFWNLNDPWVVDYLDQKLVRFLRENGFGYLKVDYNDNIGIGCDHPDSFGEGLRQHVEGVYRSFERIHEGVEDIIIENCASGGHRLEPSMMALTEMSSFSDAHESTNIPIVARQLHHLMPPRQSQIWAVLYPEDSPERFVYSLAATFYGRMCLSGPIHDIGDEQMDVIRRSIALYGEVAPIIREGRTWFVGETPWNWRDPEGWCGVCRVSSEGDRAVVVVHEFDRKDSEEIICDLPMEGDWKVSGSLTDETTGEPVLRGSSLHFPAGKSFRGYVISLVRQ
ncbi:alpha-galactosidase [Puniceicoccus vermicola]